MRFFVHKAKIELEIVLYATNIALDDSRKRYPTHHLLHQQGR